MKFPKHCLLATPVVALAACGGSGSPEAAAAPFDYATTAVQPVGIAVRLDGEPASYARVTVCQALPPFDASGGSDTMATETYLNVLTNAEGLVESSLVAPKQVGVFDVIVQIPGAEGTIDYPQHAEVWGPFAPSARVRVTAGELSNMALELIGG